MVEASHLDRIVHIIHSIRAADIPLLAAAIAFYALLSIIPIAVVGVAVVTTIGGVDLVAPLADSLDHLVTEELLTIIAVGLGAEAARSGVTILGLLVFVWGATRVFRGLDRAFNVVYGKGGTTSLPKNVLNALAVVGAIFGIILAIAAAIAGLELIGLTLPSLVAPIAVTPVLAVIFTPLYILFPPRRPPVLHAFAGAIVAAVGVTLATAGLQLYVTMAAPYAVYGVLGGIFLAMTWFYVVAIAILFGAVVTANCDDQFRQVHEQSERQYRPEPTMGEDVTPDGDDRDEELAQLRAEVEALEQEIEERTVHRDDIEQDLRRYIRQRMRRGHARGWGPYLVLLYGTVMTVGAFYYLSSAWAILAMIVIWLSTLGLYVLMLLTGVTLGMLGVPRRMIDRIRQRK